MWLGCRGKRGGEGGVVVYRRAPFAAHHTGSEITGTDMCIPKGEKAEGSRSNQTRTGGGGGLFFQHKACFVDLKFDPF